MNFILNKKLSRMFSILFILMIVLSNTSSIGTVVEPQSASEQLTETPLLDNELPKFGTNYTLAIGNTSDSFNFTINVTDNVELDKVYVNYTWAEAGQNYNKSMTNITGNWTYVAIMPEINTIITYHFWANDTTNNSNQTGFGYVTVNDNDPPLIINGTGNITIGTDNEFTIIANFTDNVDVTSATIYYRNATAGTYSNAIMNEGTEGNFSATKIYIGFDTSTDLNYYYYVIAKDAANNSVNYTSNITQSLPWEINVTDDDPPTNVSGTFNFTINVGSGFTIYANFTDNLGAENVSAANISYKKVTESGYNWSLMQKTGPGEFKITNDTMGIDTSFDDVNYYYNLSVNDSVGNNATYPIDFDYLITVKDLIAPISTNGSGNISAKCSTGFTIFANFSDNINLNTAKINYSYEFNGTYQTVNMTEDSVLDGHFYVTNTTMDVDFYANLTNLTYNVIGYDNEGNDARYNDTGGTDWNITIVDDVAPNAVSGSGDFDGYQSFPFKIWVNLTDNVNVTKVELYFKLESGVTYYELDMACEGNSCNFSVNSDNLTQVSELDFYYLTTPVVYYILSYDPFDNIGNYSNSGGDWVVTIIDDVKPDLINCTRDFTITTGEPFTIYANFTDNINISHANIIYKRKNPSGGGTPYKTKSMIETVGKKGYFYVTKEYLEINTYTDDSDILFYYKAFDQMGENISIPMTGSGDYKITIEDNDGPWVDSGSENITIGTGNNGGTFKVFGNFSDNIEVDYIEFYYKKESADTWEFQRFTTKDDDEDKVWRFQISSAELFSSVDTTNDDSDYHYYFKIFDGGTIRNMFNYTYATSGFKIAVIDDDPPVSAPNAGSAEFSATTGEQFVIYANFTDNIKVANTTLYIRGQSESTSWSDGYNMSELVGKPGKFFITNSDLNINTTHDDSDYEYYVESIDPTGNSVNYGTESEPFVITVYDDDDPIVVPGPHQEVEEGTTVYFNAEDSNDNIDIVSYVWTFTYERLEKELKGAQTQFTFEYPEKKYEIILTVRDAEGNDAKGLLWVNVSKKNYPPEIITVKPVEGEQLYVFDKHIEISVRFSENMKLDIKNITFFYLNDSAGNNVVGRFSWNNDTYKLSYSPDAELKYDETYTITVTTAVTDLTGRHLLAGKSWSFSTYPEDSDEDNLPDWWEVEKFYNYGTHVKQIINQVGPSDDPDKDGFTNLEELEGDTHPNNANDHPAEKSKDKKEAVNFLLYSVAIILVVLVLVILIVGMMIYRKKKAEAEEERKKITPIEHEILFEEGGADFGPLPETAQAPLEPSAGPPAPPEGGSEKEQMDEIVMEPALKIPEDEVTFEEPNEDGEEYEGEDELLAGEDEEPGEEYDEDEINAEDELDLEDLDLDAETPAPETMEQELQQYIDTGRQYYDEGKYTKAILEWQKALDIDPDQPEITELMREAMGKLKSEE